MNFFVHKASFVVFSERQVSLSFLLKRATFVKIVITSLSAYLFNKNHSISLMNSVIYFAVFRLVSIYDT